MKAVTMNRAGGPEVLQLVEREDPVPGTGEVLVEVAAAGVNFMDIGVRQKMAWIHMPPSKTLGVEGAGHVIALGPDVKTLHVGQRVAYVRSVRTIIDSSINNGARYE